MTSPLRVAVVGCGAVSKANLLPVLAGHDGLRLAALIDRDLARAQELAAAYSVPRAVTDMDAVMNDVDAVVLATPPAHHAQATVDLAARGKHVFVEKPMATTLAGAEGMVAAADRGGVVLSVGLYRRMLPAVRLLRALLERGDYGRPLAIDAEEGGPYGWQLASLDVLTRTGGGGGVLIDIGSHVIDVLLHVLPADPRLVNYADNSSGGIETDCLAQFSFSSGRADVPVRLELSRTRELRGSIRIRCERATLELLRGNFTQILVHSATSSPEAAPSPVRITAEWAGQQDYLGYQAFREEIDDWVTAISDRTQPMLSGRSVLPVVGLIDACYRERQPLVEPGADTAPAERSEKSPVRVESNTKKRVLVTGAGGFLGGRTVEMLRDSGEWDVVALVHEPKGAARLARWPAEILVGDICSASDMDRAMRGCDAVVHCAVGTSWKPDEVRRVTVEGTRTVAEAALRAGVTRFVHISTLFVHRRNGASVIDEDTPLEPPAGDSYGQNKLEAERALAAVAAKGLSTIVLRPTRIYGPFSRTFTVRPLQALSEGRLAVGGDASVPANMVYVDNVVAAIAAALDAPAALGGSAFLITDPDQVTLREFYEFFGRANGSTLRLRPDWRSDDGSAAPRGLVSRWISGLGAIATSPELRGIVRRVLDTDPIGTLPRRFWDRSPKFQQKMLSRFGADAAVIYRPPVQGSEDELVYVGEPGRVSCTKAIKDLKFVPARPSSEAMALTLEWARYARLLPSPLSAEARSAKVDEGHSAKAEP